MRRLHVLRSHGVPHPPQLLHHRVHFQEQQNATPVPHFSFFKPVLRIRIHRIHMFLGLLDPDPDPLVRDVDRDRDPDLDPSITPHQAKKVRKALIATSF